MKITRKKQKQNARAIKLLRRNDIDIVTTEILLKYCRASRQKEPTSGQKPCIHLANDK
jgi:hypothetical protein